MRIHYASITINFNWFFPRSGEQAIKTRYTFGLLSRELESKSWPWSEIWNKNFVEEITSFNLMIVMIRLRVCIRQIRPVSNKSTRPPAPRPPLPRCAPFQPAKRTREFVCIFEIGKRFATRIEIWKKELCWRICELQFDDIFGSIAILHLSETTGSNKLTRPWIKQIKHETWKKSINHRPIRSKSSHSFQKSNQISMETWRGKKNSNQTKTIEGGRAQCV